MKTKRNHGGKRPGAGRPRGSKNPNAGRKPGSANKLTLRLAGEQRRTREPRPKMLMRLVRQGRVRKRQLKVSERLRFLKEACELSVAPMPAVVVNAAEWSAMIEKARAARASDPTMPLAAIYRLSGAFTAPAQGAVRAAIGLG